MKKTTGNWLMATSLTLALFGVTACDVDQTEEGSLPDVDVQTEGGNLPKYDVETPDVDVGTKEKTITVPDVDVDIPDENEK